LYFLPAAGEEFLFEKLFQKGEIGVCLGFHFKFHFISRFLGRFHEMQQLYSDDMMRLETTTTSRTRTEKRGERRDFC